MNKKLKQVVNSYKKSMMYIFKIKYGLTTYSAWKLIIQYNFDEILKRCNYVALHDNPEIWVDEIYKWKYL